MNIKERMEKSRKESIDGLNHITIKAEKLKKLIISYQNMFKYDKTEEVVSYLRGNSKPLNKEATS